MAAFNFQDLQRLCGRDRPSAVKRWLQERGIRYSLDAEARPWTTEKFLNEAIGSGRKNEPNWPVPR